MKLQLTMKGGIYGIQVFEPLDTDTLDSKIAAEVLSLILSPQMDQYLESHQDELPRSIPGRSEFQTFELEVAMPDSTRRYRWTESSSVTDDKLATLVKVLLRWSKPVAGR